MTKHNKNAKSKKRVLKKKSLRKTKRRNIKNSKRGGDFSGSAKKYSKKFYNKFKENIIKDHKQAVKGTMKMIEDGLEVKEDEDPLTILVGLVGTVASPFIGLGFYIAFMIVVSLTTSLFISTKHTMLEKSNNSYNGGSIFRDGKALTHVSKNPCQGNENDTVVVKGLGMGLETHDEIYVCKGNEIDVLESIARTRINRYISRIGMKQLFKYKRKYHLLAALYNVPDTFDELKPLLDDASQNNPKLEKYITDNLSDLNDDVKTQYAAIVKALKNAVKHYCDTSNNDQELSEVCKTYNQEQDSNNENTEGFMEGIKVLLLPTLKEMGKYINA
jgi:hypothetical protein